MQNLSQEELLRYTRHLPVIGLKGQEKLKNAKVLCVGGGGLGCPALQYLAASGVGTIGIIDGDQIELSNLQRQILFYETDIGRNKALVIGERLRMLNSQLSLDVYQTFLSAREVDTILPKYDIVLDASDNYPTRYLLNHHCRLLKKPLISASIFQFEAQLSVFNYHDGPCYQCLYALPPPKALSPNCSLAGVLGVLPGVAGTLQAVEAIKIILESPDVLSGTLLSLDLLTMQFKRFDIAKHNCNLHPSIEFATETTEDQSTELPEITASELAQLIADNAQSMQLLDVRESFEREICHIGGVHIPLSSLTNEDVRQVLDPDKLVIVYCKSGARSKNACLQLKTAGFKQVQSLTGGIIHWIKTIDNRLLLY